MPVTVRSDLTVVRDGELGMHSHDAGLVRGELNLRRENGCYTGVVLGAIRLDLENSLSPELLAQQRVAEFVRTGIWLPAASTNRPGLRKRKPGFFMDLDQSL
jgi:hypothetical protein